ncbi:hypothetical protein LTR85_010220 [Meristemomyces frigidus]|nr:hypothetical protein LTR85_010220 [Meristemomyces frigidus]
MASGNGTTSGLLGHQLHVGPAFSWASIGLAVFTAILQGLVAALAYMTESSSQWTFRFRLARAEHVWWIFVSVMLFASLVMSAIAFAAGRGGDPVSVLALSSATFLAVVQYAVPAWQQRHYVETRWLAWTGESRTAIQRRHLPLCGDGAAWARSMRLHRQGLGRLQNTPTDYYGWTFWRDSGHAYDPTDLFRVLTPEHLSGEEEKGNNGGIGVFASADPTSHTVSFLWGSRQGFRRRASRAVSSMPLDLLRARTLTVDGYDGRGLALAMGILGRNKGLEPWKLVFRTDHGVLSMMENSSTWAPRPAKVLRSIYKHVMHTQYHGLGDAFVSAAVELAILMADIPNWALDQWLRLGLEQQSLETSNFLDRDVLATCNEDERIQALDCHYQSSYAAMIISINAMTPPDKAGNASSSSSIGRPDLICTVLLMKARGLTEPTWWSSPEVRCRFSEDFGILSPLVDWKTATDRLLGLNEWPESFDNSPPLWEAL